MTQFVNPHFPAEHPGVVRAEEVAHKLQGYKSWMASARGMATLLASAGVAAVLAVADELIDTWADGHLVAAWAFLWAVGFLTLAVLAPVARVLVSEFLVELRAWRAQVQAERQDARMLAAAARDPRLAAELRAAILRHEQSAAGQSEAAQRDAQRAQATAARDALNAALDGSEDPQSQRLLRSGHLGHLAHI